MSAPTPRPTPPRGTMRVQGERPPNQIMCPGCGEMISRAFVACRICWRAVPGELKAELTATTPATIGRARVVAAMRAFLRDRDPA